ncbi:MAG: hypothetical protein NTU55_01660 [Actinobacteria bacterium]|nr:hypothetical protein [Actinomycetota bacterium]
MEILSLINFVSAISILSVSIFGLPLKKLNFSSSNVVLLMTSDGKLPILMYRAPRSDAIEIFA